MQNCKGASWSWLILIFIPQCDQAKEGLVNNASQMDEYCSDRGFLGWFETSAKEDINISEAAKYLVSKVLWTDLQHIHIINFILITNYLSH